MSPMHQDASSVFEKVAKHLVDTGRISIVSFPVYRYVPLRSSDMFKSLVDLYATQFRAHWHHFKFKRLVESIRIPTGLDGSTYIARVLLSHWLIDVYVSNWKAVRQLSLSGFSDHFMHKEVVQSQEYDAFLVYLHASLRPTNIRGALAEHSLYTPLMAENVNWENTMNPFNIEGFTLDIGLFQLIISTMKCIWNIIPITNDAVGGPCWLFDWHEGNKVCTWFPFEGNFTMVDVSLAYVVGVACTPNLGARDVDDWQEFHGCIPAHPNPCEFERSEARRFYGDYEIRTIETRSIYLKGTKDSLNNWKLERCDGPETSTEDDSGTGFTVTIPQYQLTDWCYYARVIRRYDEDTRRIAHRMASIG